MNMKNILTCLAVLTMSFNVFAVAAQEELTMTTTVPVRIALTQENSPDAHLAAHIVNSQTIPQASTERSRDYLTELSVYLIIIIVYSIYGFRANSKNAGN